MEIGSNHASLPWCQWRSDECASPGTSSIITYVARHYTYSIDLIVYIFNAADIWVKIPLTTGNKKNPLCVPIQKTKLVSVYWLKSHHEKCWWSRRGNMAFSLKICRILTADRSDAWVVVMLLAMNSSIIQSIYAFYIYVYVYNTSAAQFTTFQRVQASYYDTQQSSVIEHDTSNPQRIRAEHAHTHTYIALYHMCATAGTAFIHT
jgi:hypothetical protein